MSETKKRKKPGPKKIMFTEEQLQEAQRLAGLGFSEEAICQELSNFLWGNHFNGKRKIE